MKRIGAIFIVLILLTGCSSGESEINRAMELRAKLLRSDCSFTAEITADYGDKVYTFVLACSGDARGDLAFEVVEPESISGITGTITGEGGFLTFDDAALQFDLLADDQVTPVSAPWIFLKTLRGGYLTAAGEEADLLRVTIDDSYEDDALQLDIWLNDENIPVQADILYDGLRILSLKVTDFVIE